MESLAVIRRLLREDLDIPAEFFLEFIMHPVGLNWRQRHSSARRRIQALDESLVHVRAESILVAIDDHKAVSRLLETAGRRRVALSVTSRVWNEAAQFSGHLALMNLHPEGYLSEAELGDAVLRVAGGIPGYLLSSGRFYHYYGTRLLSDAGWLDLLSRFLLPCTLVSPRYIGHSLSRRYCALRLNSVPPHKPRIPHLISVLG